MSTFVFDIEGDGLNPTKIHCLSVVNVATGKIHSTTSYDEMRGFFEKASIVICHNAKRFDVPVLERILGIKITCKVVDTLALSWYLFPNRARHGLEGWGQDFGVPKPLILDWDNLPIEEYIHRCEEDVKINLKLWKKMYRYLVDLYESKDNIWKFLDYIDLKMTCAVLQEKSRWKMDVPYVQESLQTLLDDKTIKFDNLIAAMPEVPDIQIKTKPKRFLNANGDYSKLGMEWVGLLADRGLPLDYDGDVEIIKGMSPGNPNSSEQIKSWLYSLGWVPRTFKYVKGPEGTRAIPQINQDQGKGICESIKDLYHLEPNLELLDGLSVLSHRIGLLKGFLRDVSPDGYIQAQVQGFTNTLRFQHTTVVNLPKVNKPYGEFIRGALIAPEGYELCGSDMASLEDRIKQSFIFPYDPDYVNAMNTPDFDPHLIIAEMAGMLTAAQVAEYKNGVMIWKPVRDIAKNGNYAWIWAFKIV